MCGIAGVIERAGQSVDEGLLRRICDRMSHRGPDAQGIHVDGCVGLGHRRLSIIDLGGGRQPMSSDDGAVCVVFNGEIYNFQELRGPLERAGHRFATTSDTEVLLRAYQEHGPACVGRLRGMFAFAIWDARKRSLFLARDRVGKKPVYYADVPGGPFVFASGLHALLAHPAVPRELDPEALDDYLTYGYVPSPKTVFRGVSKLPPGCTLTLPVPADGASGPGAKVERYWRLEYGPKLVLTEAEAEERLLELLTEAVRLRMIADVPLGALLSGGVDSSVVVALMSRLSDRPVKTFSIGFEERAFDELPHARRVAERYGTEHHELIVRPQALDVLPTLVRHYGEPYADSSAVPTYYVSQLTRQHVTVALNGDGGDESFAGYDRYFGHRLAERYRALPRPLRAGLVEPLSRLIPGTLSRRNRLGQLKRFLQVAARPSGPRYVRWMSYLAADQRQELYTDDFRQTVGRHDSGAWLEGLLEEAARSGCGRGGLDMVLSADVRSYLTEDLLAKVDVAMMAHGLEGRSPLLDHEVMEFAARLPESYKLRGTNGKYLLKSLARRLVPEENLSRRKMGFGVPVGTWMRGELRPLLDDVLLSARALDRGYFRPEVLERYVREHAEGRRDHSYSLWALLWLELWHREFVDAAGAGAGEEAARPSQSLGPFAPAGA